MSADWIITRTGPALHLSRKGAVRWDVAARTHLPDLARGRLAHLIRQDVWRALRNVRGFRPMINVSRADKGGLEVRAGGQVDGPVAPTMAAAVQSVLDDMALRRRWIRGARHQ